MPFPTNSLRCRPLRRPRHSAQRSFCSAPGLAIQRWSFRPPGAEASPRCRAAWGLPKVRSSARVSGAVTRGSTAVASVAQCAGLVATRNIGRHEVTLCLPPTSGYTMRGPLLHRHHSGCKRMGTRGPSLFSRLNASASSRVGRSAMFEADGT